MRVAGGKPANREPAGPRMGRPPRPPPSPGDRQRLERLYVTQGLSVSEVGRRLGMTRKQAEGILMRAGIPLRQRGSQPLAPPAEAERRRLERLYVTEGVSVSELARR